MKKPFKIAISALAIAVLYNAVWLIVVYILKIRTKNLYHQVQFNERLYTYEMYRGALNSVLYVDDLNDSNIIINFYDCWAKGIDTDIGTLAIKYMPLTLKDPVYVLRDLGPKSDIIELVSFDTSCWGYFKGYVYKRTTHRDPPPNSLVAKLLSREDKKNTKNEIDISHLPNPYGFYCRSCK